MQKGYIYQNGKHWTLRYYEDVLEDGQPVRKQKTHKLAPIGDQYPNKTSVRELADGHLAPINGHQRRPESSQRVVDFLEHTYLPHVRETLRPSTAKSYTQMFGLAKPHLGEITLHEFRTPDAVAVLRAVTAEKQRAHTTHCNLKNFLSGAFRYGIQEGAIDRENPIREAGIPRGKRKGNRPAYTLDEVTGMLAVLPEPARTVVFTAALTGLRLCELKGLRWEDFNGNEVLVQRNVWNGIVSDTKTLTSRAAVPVVPFLTEALEEHKRRNSGTGFVFHGSTGQPLRMENIFRRDMKGPLAKAKISWRGWHPFRYGVGTTLRSLGVDGKIIQAILRHANIATTMDLYVKPVGAESHAAMRKLERAFKSATAARKLA